jgi:hypothetical protein
MKDITSVGGRTENVQEIAAVVASTVWMLSLFCRLAAIMIGLVSTCMCPIVHGGVLAAPTWPLALVSHFSNDQLILVCMYTATFSCSGNKQIVLSFFFTLFVVQRGFGDCLWQSGQQAGSIS